MQKITWSDDLELGIKFIDNHHKTLIGIANEFINAANRQCAVASLMPLLRKMREEAVSHLNIEEKIMASVRYRKRAMHSLGNQRFKLSLQAFNQRLQNAGTVTPHDIKRLKETLVEHIQNSNEAITQSMVQTPFPKGWRNLGQRVNAVN